jgi:hypothetical protein
LRLDMQWPLALDSKYDAFHLVSRSFHSTSKFDYKGTILT